MIPSACNTLLSDAASQALTHTLGRMERFLATSQRRWIQTLLSHRLQRVGHCHDHHDQSCELVSRDLLSIEITCSRLGRFHLRELQRSSPTSAGHIRCSSQERACLQPATMDVPSTQHAYLPYFCCRNLQRCNIVCWKTSPVQEHS